MQEKENYFSPSHNRLLAVATWAKYLAWVVLIVHILWVGATYIQEQNFFMSYRALGSNMMKYRDFMDFLRQVPSYGFSVLIEIIGVFLRGIVYFLVLKGISLGLYMIVETDLNYRDQKRAS